MKKIVAFLTAFAFMLSLNSCGNKEEPPTVAYLDFSVSSGAFFAQSCFMRGSTVYWLCDNNVGKLWFSDTEMKCWLPLCGRPECMHRDRECNSWLEGTYCGSRVWPVGEHIYYIIQDTKFDGQELWRMKLDGNGHEPVLAWDLSEIDAYCSSYSWDWFFHGRYALVFFRGETAENEFTFASFVIDLSADEPELSRLPFNEWMPTGTPYAGDGDLIYGVEFSPDPNGINRVIKTDLAAGTREVLCELPFRPGLYAGGLVEDKLLFASLEGHVVSVDTATGGVTLTEKALPPGGSWFLAVKYWVASWGTDGGGFGTHICELDGTTVCELPASAYGGGMLITHIVGNLVFGYEDPEAQYSKPPERYLDLNEAGTESFAWHSWEE